MTIKRVMDKKINSSRLDPVRHEIIGFTPPRLATGRETFVFFYAFDPMEGKMKRKKYMLGRCHTQKEIKERSRVMIANLTRKLSGGWNPWIEGSDSLAYTTFEDAMELYHDYIYKRLNDGSMREDTVSSYASYLRIFRDWAALQTDLQYIFQFNDIIVSRFLDYVYMGRNNSFVTRNNYLCWLRVLCGYLMERGYLTVDPCSRFQNIKIPGYVKERTVIPDDVMARIREYLRKKNPYFLLACYLTHYLMIRPKELSRMRVGDINICKCTVTLMGDQTKKHCDAVITIPKKVLELMKELDIFRYHSDCYLFSDGFKPGERQRTEKQFRDFWHHHVRQDLNFSSKYVYYSLKDTGITNMLRNGLDPLSVRDQARHSSLLLTKTYTPLDIKEANPLILKYDGVL